MFLLKNYTRNKNETLMQIIAQRQQSGLTVKEFCAQQDIPIKQYYYWQHKLRIRF